MIHRAAYCLLLLAVSGCSVFGITNKLPMAESSGDNIVCVIMNDKPFKWKLVENLRVVLAVDNYEIATVDRKDSEKIDPARYAAVVYIAEYRYWHLPGDAKDYYNRHPDSDNVVYVITSSSADREISEPFDAVTTASHSWQLHDVSMELVQRLNPILKREN